MSKLFSPDDTFSPKVRSLHDAQIIRHRRKNPLHPEEIQRRLRARAADSFPKPEEREWLLILWRPDGTKHFSDLEGSYQQACSGRDDIMQSGEYDKAWLILKTPSNTRK